MYSTYKGNQNKDKIENLVGNYAKIITYAFLLLIIIVFPFYAPHGYEGIGTSKFYFFRAAGLVCFGLLAPAAVFLIFRQVKKGDSVRLSITDKALLLYGGAVLLSFLCSDWKKNALWGIDGWYMGALTQLMFIAIYFAVSRFIQRSEVWYVLFMVVSSGVFLHGLLNRFSFYPVQMKGANPGFISSLGNINWFCGYWMLVFPIGLVFYWSGLGNTILKKTGLILYTILGFMIGIVQGSNSGFLALGTVFFVLFLLSFEKEDKILKWLELVVLFAVSILLISILKGWFPGRLNYQNTIEEILTKYTVGFGIFVIAVISYSILHYLLRKKNLEVKKLLPVRNGVAVFAVLVIIIMFLLVLYYNVRQETAGTSKLAQVFLIDADWGNGRGTTWKAGVQAFVSMPFRKKIIGVGPDCFYEYAYSNWDIAVMLYNVFGDARLTNTHNEWLTLLVNVGVCGLLFYVTAFMSSVFRQLKAGKKQELLLVSAVCILTYVVHNMVSFQQVISTPIAFILLGMGENLIRNISIEKEKCLT